MRDDSATLYNACAEEKVFFRWKSVSLLAVLCWLVLCISMHNGKQGKACHSISNPRGFTLIGTLSCCSM